MKIFWGRSCFYIPLFFLFCLSSFSLFLKRDAVVTMSFRFNNRKFTREIPMTKSYNSEFFWTWQTKLILLQLTFANCNYFEICKLKVVLIWNSMDNLFWEHLTNLKYRCTQKGSGKYQKRFREGSGGANFESFVLSSSQELCSACSVDMSLSHLRNWNLVKHGKVTIAHSYTVIVLQISRCYQSSWHLFGF